MPPAENLSPTVLEALVRAAFGPRAHVDGHTPLTGGTYNTVHAVVLRDGRRSVLKLAPPPDRPRLTYEQDLLATEALAYTRARPAVRRWVPRVLRAGTVPGDPRRAYLFLEHLPGRPLDGLRSRLEPRRLAPVRRALGGAVAALHTVTGTGFGYPGNPRLRAATWPEAFTAMVEAVVADAARLGVALPGGGARIIRLVADNRAHLAPVRVPVLVHFDLWDGNVLVTGTGEGDAPALSGIIDAERAFWGDPAADLVSLALFGDVRGDPALLEGYRAAGGRVGFTPALLRRITLYRVYLHLIMFTELTPRGYGHAEAERVRTFLAPLLAADLDRLATPAE
ncbi:MULTISPECIES: phosphotransferase family protein [unclassified Nocardiopsis]|uniref:phosphotransferase family protein n=1 Tax=unclassified Nocardiopsis TaxID=2649073 RepID=UPI001356AE0A|nr:MULTISPECIES: aminoglycoside phosphotransferase family protein [unclassified Nocardiopsis]